VVAVRVADADSEPTLGREIDPTTFVAEKIRSFAVTDSLSHQQTVAQGAGKGYRSWELSRFSGIWAGLSAELTYNDRPVRH